MNRSVCFLMIGDVRYDGRSYNMARSLLRRGFRVLFLMTAMQGEELTYDGIQLECLGLRRWPSAKLTYLQYYLKALPRALKSRCDVYIAADLFSLPIAFAAARYHRARVVYDCKEFFFALASLQRRPFIQTFWSLVERLFIRKVDAVMAAGEEDVRILADRYAISAPTAVLNHPPNRERHNKVELRSRFHLPASCRILLYQGGLQSGRGLGLMLDLLQYLPKCAIVFIGDGHLKDQLQRRAIGLEGRVFFLGRVPYKDLLDYTASADLGMALIEDYGLSYQYARPNKLFEYIMAEVPVVVTDFPVMKKIVEEHNVGIAVSLHHPKLIAEAIDALLSDEGLYQSLKANCRIASKCLSWETEEKKFLRLIEGLLPANSAKP
jgi:glycosyltransferase involved in cell wall biosynthesis